MRVLALSKEVLGPKHMITVHALLDIVANRNRSGQMDDAAEEAEKGVLELAKEVLGPKHSATFRVMGTWSSKLCQQDRCKEAEAILIEVLGSLKGFLGPRHPHTITAMGTLESTQRTLGRYERPPKWRKRFLG